MKKIKIYIFIICSVALSFFCGSCCSKVFSSEYYYLPKVNYVGMTYQEAFTKVIEEENEYLNARDEIEKDYCYFSYLKDYPYSHIYGEVLLTQGEEREKALKELFNAPSWTYINHRTGVIFNYRYYYRLQFENGVVVSQETCKDERLYNILWYLDGRFKE